MKILLITEIFPPKVGGSGRWFWEIYSRLSRERYVVAAGADVEAAAFDATHGISCFRWPLTLSSWGVAQAGNYLRLLRLLVPWLRQDRVASLHCGRCLPEGLLAFAAHLLTGVPYLCYVHGEELTTYQSSREYRYLSRLVFSRASRIIVNSKNTRDVFLRLFGHNGGAVRLLYPGVDTGYFRPAAHDAAFRERMGWSGKKVLLTVGRLQKRKGHDHTIFALSRIAEAVPDVLYAVVGDGEERDYLERLALEHHLQERVQFLGKVDDRTLLSCYQQCDLFILANREVEGDFEGYGMVLVEAQACGKPVVAGRSGGTAETMRVGETGFLVDGDQPEAIAEAVVAALADDVVLRAMGRKAVQWVRSALDWGPLTAQAEGIFGEVGRSRHREGCRG